MRVAIVGSRTITDKNKVLELMKQVAEQYKPRYLTILSGGANGVDTLAREVAKEAGLDFILFKPYHLLDPQTPYSPRYFFVRNKQIADNADVVGILWDGKSNGTRHMIEYCKKRVKPYVLLTVS